MDLNQRIKYLRKERLRMTQEEFASSIKISRSNLGSIEIGRVKVTDRVIQDICEKFNINEEWLRTGKGEIPKKLDREQEIASMTVMLFKEEDSSFKYRLISALSKLSENDWETLERLAKEITDKND